VLSFGSSSALSNAYGIAVAGTMSIVTALMIVHESRTGLAAAWRVPVLVALALVDVGFLVANLVKVPQGGWFPLLYGALVLLVMRTWVVGRRRVHAEVAREAYTWERFGRLVDEFAPRRVPGFAVFLDEDEDTVPATLVRNVRANGVLHENTVLLTVRFEPVPFVARGRSVEVRRLEHGLRRVTAHVGFMERPDVPAMLHVAERLGLGARARDAWYVVGGEDVVFESGRGMPLWRKYLFLFLSRNARSLAARLRIPPQRVVTIGGQVPI
jgi:KUP system potassium uptake protein